MKAVEPARQRLAQPWFERRDYPLLLELVPLMPPTWQEWRWRADAVRKAAATSSTQLVQDRFNVLDLQQFMRRQMRDQLTPEELLAWCQRRMNGEPDPPPAELEERFLKDRYARRPQRAVVPKPRPRRTSPIDKR
jgi:hypothetical protein